ncbi:MAG: ribosomal RNA small subunit methyltransferase A [Deltaproteobacteria bacterium]|nr:ribosomal RNA small subunit methyltransferase A [Deltaproteobacteria bacterium]
MTSTRKMIRHYGIRPRKRLGQSFLQDKNIVNKIIDTAGIVPGETIVEIGAGLGIMTERLANLGARVIALEIDPSLAAVLKERFENSEKIEIVQTDALKYDFSGIHPEGGREQVKVIGNVPYRISTAILFRLFEFRRNISSLILMFQEEVAQRITAAPGTDAYGIPSVMAAMFARAGIVLTVPASCFYPVPKVTSAVVKIDFLERPAAEIADADLFMRIVRIAFAKRRKTLLNNLRSGALPDLSEADILEVLQSAGIDGRRRAETLSAPEFAALANAILKNRMLER